MSKCRTPSRPEGAPKGNKNAEKLNTPAKRAEAYRLYCLHLAAGFSGGCFYDPCLEDTIISTLKKYPNEFDHDLQRLARAKGRMYWEDIGNKGSVGKIRGFNSHAWKFNMQNRLGWKDRMEAGLDENTRAVFVMKMGKKLDEDK